MTEIWNGTFREPEYWDHFGHRLVELAEIGAGASVLDVGTGWKGAVLFPAARAVGPRGQVVGIDMWESCARQTLDAIKEHELGYARAAQMNASSMAFGDACFDVALCGFVGWNDVFDFALCEYHARDRKIEEILRVLKVGGRVGISAWAMQEDSEWMGELVSGHLPADGPREQAVLCYSKETIEGLEKVLRSAGLKDIKIVTEKVGFVYQDEEEWLEVMRQYGWHRYLEKIKSLPASELQRFEEHALDKLNDHKRADGIHFNRTVIFALGTK